MDVALFAQDVDQLSQLLGECHLHEERDALAQVMMPIASYAGQLASGLQSPYASTAAASGLYADELLRRLQGCQSLDEGRATCAEMMTAFHQEHSQQLLRPRVPAKAVPAQEAQEVQAAGVNELLARLQSLQGANRVIVRALRIMSERLREQGQRSRQAEETVEQLKSELQAQSEQLRASERAKALLQSRVEVLLREDFQMPQGCGRPCS
ncbi:unnamed protein product [Durusdinium trenchii]|uniref:Uncharacterized protein n=2 Tax=Durusdinium trenchii TaxID=1381693 RepID=A0ABP0I932_9DINO